MLSKPLAFAAAVGLAISLSGCGAIRQSFDPDYKTHLAAINGEAELAQATYNRRIRVNEAQAMLDAADLTAKAEVRKAQGVAQANQIMSASLGGPEGYLRWKYIEMLQESKEKQIIYVPTEAGLPILEAGRRPVAKPAE